MDSGVGQRRGERGQQPLIYNNVTTKFSSLPAAFGVLLWELATYGKTPYPLLRVAQVYDKISTGYRMPAPEGCPDEVYQLMKKCKCNYPTTSISIHHYHLTSITVLMGCWPCLNYVCIFIKLCLINSLFAPISIHTGEFCTKISTFESSTPLDIYKIKIVSPNMNFAVVQVYYNFISSKNSCQGFEML